MILKCDTASGWLQRSRRCWTSGGRGGCSWTGGWPGCRGGTLPSCRRTANAPSWRFAARRPAAPAPRHPSPPWPRCEPPWRGCVQVQGGGVEHVDLPPPVCSPSTAADTLCHCCLRLLRAIRLLVGLKTRQAHGHMGRRWWTTSSAGRTRRSPPATRTARRTSGRCRGTGAKPGGCPPAWRRPTAPSRRREVPTGSRPQRKLTRTRLLGLSAGCAATRQGVTAAECARVLKASAVLNMAQRMCILVLCK